MDAIRRYLKTSLPRYLKGLPLPRTFSGFLKLKYDDWMYLAPLLITILALGLTLFAGKNSTKPGRLNRKVQLEKEKVVDFISLPDVEEIIKTKGKCTLCRCWKSKNFPYCDGAHLKHNKETSDNVGPLVLTAKSA
ncbi:hypothetical protein CCR75_002581 [Bremia lactucae]|uniref:Iron-binding zinc finger CDGSH type domain-containing protein n=1 Tax=Bremia lactucae TaxID=4779 RepID=A0A976FMF7_BRELC|nr:hypothetical protein CCR75_002581 [Bremia lactucae]